MIARIWNSCTDTYDRKSMQDISGWCRSHDFGSGCKVGHNRD